jgi:hypothetical protein
MITWRELNKAINELPEKWLDYPVTVERDTDAGEFIRAIGVAFNLGNAIIQPGEPYIRTATRSDYPTTGKE